MDKKSTSASSKKSVPWMDIIIVVMFLSIIAQPLIVGLVYLLPVVYLVIIAFMIKNYLSFKLTKKLFRTYSSYLVTKILLLMGVIYSTIYTLLLYLVVFDPRNHVKMAMDLVGEAINQGFQGTDPSIINYLVASPLERIPYVFGPLTGKGWIIYIPVLVAIIIILVVHYLIKSAKSKGLLIDPKKVY